MSVMMRTRTIAGYALLGLAVLMVVNVVMRRVNPPPVEDCILHGRVAVVGRDTLLGQQMGWPSDTLGLKNLNGQPWHNAEIMVSGFVTTGTNTTHPTGAYTLNKGLIEPYGLVSLKLEDFQKPAGERWASVNMRVSDIAVKATIDGRSCAGEMRMGSVESLVADR
jgi:hypothetical protein